MVMVKSIFTYLRPVVEQAITLGSFGLQVQAMNEVSTRHYE